MPSTVPSSAPASAPGASLRETDTTIPVPGSALLKARIYGERRPGTPLPLVLHFHGGAFVSGDLESGACMARLLAESGAVVVSLAYPLAPEHRFPEAVEAGYAGLEWAYKQRNKLAGGDRVYLAGDEAGGNLAAAVALVARDRAHPPLAGQILVAPMLDPCVGTASLRESMECNIACKWSTGWQQYLRGPRDAEHPYAVPAHATRLEGLPPALILSGHDDPLRDEARAYAKRLSEAGISVTSDVLPDTTGWPDSLAAPQECPCATTVRDHLRAFFSAALPQPS